MAFLIPSIKYLFVDSRTQIQNHLCDGSALICTQLVILCQSNYCYNHQNTFSPFLEIASVVTRVLLSFIVQALKFFVVTTCLVPHLLLSLLGPQLPP